ncbi:MAG: hypothetical protein FWC27_13340 [Firmicutes bacterium]|nr:hypothetical protein [Bacillota bacterium]
MKTVLFGEKKWWAVLQGGLFNSVAFVAIFNLFCWSSTIAAMNLTMCLAVIPFVFMIIFLSSTTFKKLFASTSVYIGTYILIGIPLSRFLYDIRFERLYPGEKPWAGDGFGMMTVTAFYLFMGLIAWIIAMIMTGFRSAQPEKGGAYGHP